MLHYTVQIVLVNSRLCPFSVHACGKLTESYSASLNSGPSLLARNIMSF